MSLKPAGFDCDREKFIGPYRNESNPLAVERGRSFNSLAQGSNPIGSQSFYLKLKAKEKKAVVFVLGVERDLKRSRRLVKKFTNFGFALNELNKLKLNWQDYLSHLSLLSPPYKTFDPGVGAIGTFAKGLKENAGISSVMPIPGQ